MKKLLIILTLFASLGCEKSFESVEDVKEKALKAEYYELLPTIDSLGRHKNPVRIEVYFGAEGITDLTQILSAEVHNLKTGDFLGEWSQPYNNHFLLWYVFEENRQKGEVFRELDTIDFQINITGAIPGIAPMLTARTYYDRSDTIYFDTDQAFRLVIPKRGEGFDKPNFIEITKL